MALINKLEAIGDAIRSKTGGTEELTLDEMATAINNIQSSSTGSLQTVVITKGYGNRIDLSNFVDYAAGDNFILFYTSKANSSSKYMKSMWMPGWSYNIYTIADATVNVSSSDAELGVENLGTTLTTEVNTSIALKTASTIEKTDMEEKSDLFFTSATGCGIGKSAILVYVG